MAESISLLSAKDISAGYGGNAVVRDVELMLRPGDYIAIVGANGSGKSTLLRALSGLLPLRTGSVHIGRHDLMRTPERAKAGLGYAVDAPDLPDDLTGSQYLELVASIKKCAARAWLGGDMIAPLQFEPWLLTCPPEIPPNLGRVRPERTDDEEGTIYGRADHWFPAGAGGWCYDG